MTPGHWCLVVHDSRSLVPSRIHDSWSLLPSGTWLPVTHTVSMYHAHTERRLIHGFTMTGLANNSIILSQSASWHYFLQGPLKTSAATEETCRVQVFISCLEIQIVNIQKITAHQFCSSALSWSVIPTRGGIIFALSVNFRGVTHAGESFTPLASH